MGYVYAYPVQLIQEFPDSRLLQRRNRNHLLPRNGQPLSGALEIGILTGPAGNNDVNPAFLRAVIIDRFHAGRTVFKAYLIQTIQQKDQASGFDFLDVRLAQTILGLQL